MKDKVRLKNRRNRLEQESLRVRQEEKRLSEKRVIEFGNILKQLDIDIDVDVFLGAMLYVKELISGDSGIRDKWREGAASYKDNLARFKKQKRRVILKIEDKMEEMENEDVTNKNYEREIRGFNLKWNSFRKEWYGYTSDYEGLREYLDCVGVRYKIDEV